MSELVVMRLKDMRRRHPLQDNSRHCSRCGQRVGVYPSGQRALRLEPGLAIVCQVCVAKSHPSDLLQVLAPGALEESKESYEVQ